MKGVTIYLIVCFVLLAALSIIHNIIIVPEWYTNNILFAQCAYSGGLGGIMYCLRAVYTNRCVLKQWDPDWHIWYYLRPITSSISGFISCIFLKAGLLVLDAPIEANNSHYGFLALAFIAGYNVDNFMKKIESIAESTWGISKSNSSSDKSRKDKE